VRFLQSIKRWCGLLSVLLFVSGNALLADELKYKPINPAFGGHPLNGPYLMGNATAQRQYDAPRRRRNAVEEFGESIQRALIARISREIVDEIMGEGGKSSGSFEIGGTTLDYNKVGDQVEIVIHDPATGGQTTITVPAPTY